MAFTNRRTGWPWLALIILILILGMVWLGQAHPPGWGPGGPGAAADPGWSHGLARPRFAPRQATTIKGEIESLGSYGRSGWRVAPGMVVQGLVLKTDNGYTEIDLGPPDYLASKCFILKMGDTLEAMGFQAARDGRTIFFAATIKTSDQRLRLLDEQGSPLWRPRGPGGPGFGGMGPDGPPPDGRGPEGMGPEGPGPGRF